jgi:hypothetical protein
MKKDIYTIFGNQLSMLLDGVDGHDPIIIKEVHSYIENKVKDFIKNNKLDDKYSVKKEYTNTLTYSDLTSDITVIENKTLKPILSIEYSSARTSFVKNKSNNAANLVSELFNYITAEVPILWIFNAVSLSLEKLDKYKEYEKDLKLFLENNGPRPKLNGTTLTVDQLNETHFSSFFKINKVLGKNKSISDVLIALIDFDYTTKTGKKSDFKNFKNNEITNWLKNSTENFENRIEKFLEKILIKKEKDSKSIIGRIKNFLKNFKLIIFGKGR